MLERTISRDLVLGTDRRIRDMIGDILGTGGVDRSPVAVLVDPTRDHWREADGFDGRVVVVLSEPTHDDVVAAVLRGADAVVDAAELAGVLSEAVVAVGEGTAYLTPVHAKAITDALRRAGVGARKPKLSKREGEILQSIAAGHSVKQTAKHLGISPKTVENLQSRLFRKLEARNRAQAVAKAYELDLLPDGLIARDSPPA